MLGLKPGYDYSKLEENGLIKENVEVDEKTVLIGKAVNDLGETYTDYICSHCLGNLTVQNICKLPHIDADLEDSRIITNHKKRK